MATIRKMSVDDLIDYPTEEGCRYELIDGELHVSKAAHWNHQTICDQLVFLLKQWDEQTKLGTVRSAPDVIFSQFDAVIPDLVWISQARLLSALQGDGKLHAAPELAIEVLSPGSSNERRDRQLKLEVYTRYGVSEYWIVNWQQKQLEVYQLDQTPPLLVNLHENDILQAPLLPGFSCTLTKLFEDLI